jgi:hypothetical protein
MQTYSNKEMKAYQVQEVVLDERSYLVAPVVMMVEGVHSGSHGALYHPATELALSASFWEGMPVVINHPQDTEGNYITANSVPGKIVGTVKNPTMDANKLKAEIWVDVDKTSIESPTTITLLKTNKILEVSTGVFSDEIVEEGTWNGETYKAVARNHKPDHLAILPNDIGACSVKDGCGIRVNKQTKDMETIQVNELIVDFRSLQVNQLSYSEISDMIWNKLKTLNVDDSQGNRIKSCWTEAIYDKYFVYQESTNNTAGTIRKYYMQNYTITNEQIEFTGSPIEVVKDLKYKQVQTNKKKMAESKTPCPEGSGLCKEAKVEALIAHKMTVYTLEDKEMLMELDEAVIDKMTPVTPEPVVVNKEIAVPVVYKTTDEFLEAAPEAIRDSLRAGLVLNEERRNALVQSILTNSVKDTWNEDELKGMNTEQLEKLNRSYPQAVTYVGNSQRRTPVVNTTASEDLLLPNGVQIKK